MIITVNSFPAFKTLVEGFGGGKGSAIYYSITGSTVRHIAAFGLIRAAVIAELTGGDAILPDVLTNIFPHAVDVGSTFEVTN